MDKTTLPVIGVKQNPLGMTDADVAALLRTQSERSQDLSRRATRINTLIEQNRDERSALEREALEKYGTSDLDALRKKLADDRAENTKRVNEFTLALDAYETLLLETEKQFGAKN